VASQPISFARKMLMLPWACLTLIPEVFKNVTNVNDLHAVLVKFPHLQKDIQVPEHLKLGANLTLDTVIKMTTLTHNLTMPDKRLPVISYNLTSSKIMEEHGLQVDPSTAINIAKSLWDVVRDNAGVVNIDTDYATATPSGITQWQDLANWKNAQPWGPFKHVWYNGFGYTECQHEWSFVWAYGGDYNGEGQYLTQATEHVTEAYAAYACSVSASSAASSPLNVGTATQPIGQITIDIQTKCCGSFSCEQKGQLVHLKGDGGGSY